MCALALIFNAILLFYMHITYYYSHSFLFILLHLVFSIFSNENQSIRFHGKSFSLYTSHRYATSLLPRHTYIYLYLYCTNLKSSFFLLFEASLHILLQSFVQMDCSSTWSFNKDQSIALHKFT